MNKRTPEQTTLQLLAQKIFCSLDFSSKRQKCSRYRFRHNRKEHTLEKSHGAQSARKLSTRLFLSIFRKTLTNARDVQGTCHGANSINSRLLYTQILSPFRSTQGIYVPYRFLSPSWLTSSPENAGNSRERTSLLFTPSPRGRKIQNSNNSVYPLQSLRKSREATVSHRPQRKKKTNCLFQKEQVLENPSSKCHLRRISEAIPYFV